MRQSARTGFSIIELLAAMAVLMVMVLLLSRVFGTAAMAWRAGNKRIESNNSGRTAIEFMARELSGIIVGQPRPKIVLDSDRPEVFDMKSDAISFVTLAHQAEFRGGEKYRDVQQVRYAMGPMVGFTNRYALYRYVTEKWGSGDFSSYESEDWLAEFDDQEMKQYGSPLADNIRTFEVFITPVNKSSPESDYVYNGLNPPAAIDIYLEVFAEEDAVLASILPDNPDTKTFLTAATRRYATRIYIQNRAGYVAQ